MKIQKTKKNIKKKKKKKKKKKRKNKKKSDYKIDANKISKIYKETSPKKRNKTDIEFLNIDLLPGELHLIKKLKEYLSKNNNTNFKIITMIIEKINFLLLLPLENITIRRLKKKKKTFSDQNSIFYLLKFIRKLFLCKFYFSKFFDEFDIISIKKNFLLWITVFYKLNNSDKIEKLTFENESLKLNVFEVNLFLIEKFFRDKNNLKEVFVEFKNLLTFYYFRKIKKKNPFSCLKEKKKIFYNEVLDIDRFKECIKEKELSVNTKKIIEDFIKGSTKKFETIVIN